MTNKPEFISSFDHTVEYKFDGENYTVRLGAHRLVTQGSYWPMVVKCIGTVMYKDHRKAHEFPPLEVVEAMSAASLNAKLVAGRWTADFTDVEYQGPTPVLAEDEYEVRLLDYAKRFNAWWYYEEKEENDLP